MCNPFSIKMIPTSILPVFKLVSVYWASIYAMLAWFYGLKHAVQHCYQGFSNQKRGLYNKLYAWEVLKMEYNYVSKLLSVIENTRMCRLSWKLHIIQVSMLQVGI